MSALVEKISVRLVRSDTNCWVWQGAKVRNGYGVVMAPGERRLHYTHRVMFEDEHGPIPPGMQIDHLCRNRACCNPAHLEAVTPAENSRRGISPQAAKARRNQKPHCRHGHAFTPENSYFDPAGNRSCRECRQIRNAEYTVTRRSKSQVYRNLTATSGNVVSIRSRKNG